MNNRFLAACLGAVACVPFSAPAAGAQGKWWNAPQLKYVEIMEEGTHGTSPHYWTFGGPSSDDSTNDQTYLYSQDSGSNAFFCQYVVSELRAAENADQVAHRWAVQHIGRPKGCSQYGDRVVVGNGGEEQAVQPFYGYPDDYGIGDRIETVLDADVPADCDPLHFNSDGSLLYTNHYLTATGSRRVLQRYRVTGSLDEDGVAFTRDTDWQDGGAFESSVARLRNFTLRNLGGTELVYYGEGDTSSNPPSVYAFDPETGEETLLVEWVFEPGEVPDSDIVNVKLTGAAAGEPYLHVMGSIGGLKIYALSADGRSVLNDGEPVAAFTPDDLNAITGSDAFGSHCRGFEATDDNEYAFFSTHNAPDSLFVIRAEPGTAVKDWRRR